MSILSSPMNLIETRKMSNDARINSNEIDQSECFSDKIFEKEKFGRLKTAILKSIAKNIEILIRNELLQNKYTLEDKSVMKYYIKRK